MYEIKSINSVANMLVYGSDPMRREHFVAISGQCLKSMSKCHHKHIARQCAGASAHTHTHTHTQYSSLTSQTPHAAWVATLEPSSSIKSGIQRTMSRRRPANFTPTEPPTKMNGVNGTLRSLLQVTKVLGTRNFV